MHDIDLITTLAGGLGVALVFGYITFRVGLSPIVGYLLAGIAVGPNSPGYVANGAIAAQMAELGVVLLMFGVGLHFDLSELSRVRRVAIPGALVQSFVATTFGMIAALVFGLSFKSALIFGVAVSFASTVVVTRVLSDVDEMQTPVGNIAVGWLIVQDLMAVLVLVLMPAFANGNSFGLLSILGILAVAIVKIAAAVFAIVIVGGRIIPSVLRHVAATHSRELFTLSILVIALGVAIGSARLFGVSMALGAFLAGIVVGQSDFSLRAATDALPMRDAFAVLFFVSVGMLFDPAVLYESPRLVLWTLAIVLVATPAVAVAIILVLGYPIPMAMKIAMSLAQIGEFSFILTNLGIQLDMLPQGSIHVLVAVSIVSISLSPVMQFFAEPLAKQICRTRWGKDLATTRKPFTLSKVTENSTSRVEVESQYRAIIVGFGPIGRTVARLLQENGIVPTIIELNHETIASIRECGYSAVLGDASIPETLSHAGIQKSVSLILSASAIRNAHEVIRYARFLNPEIKVIVRSIYLKDRKSLVQSGADHVFAGEGEVALAMAEFILRDLGATAEQIDREREKMRSDLFV